MYARWQQRVFPHKSFDEFILSLEKMSSTHALKVLLRDRRQVSQPKTSPGYVNLGMQSLEPYVLGVSRLQCSTLLENTSGTYVLKVLAGAGAR